MTSNKVDMERWLLVDMMKDKTLTTNSQQNMKLTNFSKKRILNFFFIILLNKVAY